MVPINEASSLGKPATAVFYYEQTADALVSAIRLFGECQFDEDALMRHAAEWGVARFRRELRRLVEGCVSEGSVVRSSKDPPNAVGRQQGPE